MKLLHVVLFTLSINSYAALLDKIVAVYDEKIVTLSQVNRIKSNYYKRREISKKVLRRNNNTTKEIVEDLIDAFVVRDHLNEIGYTVTDDQVEGFIKNIEKNNNIGRAQLGQFLKNKNVSFPEYFEILRKSREFEYFMGIVIGPLVSITEQQVKNEFFKRNQHNSTLAIKYDLVNFSYAKDKINSSSLKQIPGILTKYRNTGIIDPKYSSFETSNVGETHELDLLPQIRKALKVTQEGNFSKGVLIGDRYHFYFVRNKDLIESGHFKQQKNLIRSELFEVEAKRLSDIWLRRERDKHFISILI